MELTLLLIFRNLSNIKIKFGQILMYLITKITNMFLAQQCWRLETSSRPFYDFNEMTLSRDLPIFSSRYLPIFDSPLFTFLKSETLET